MPQTLQTGFTLPKLAINVPIDARHKWTILPSEEARKRQESIYELLYTEHSYLSTLLVLHELFYKNLKIKDELREAVFSGLEELLVTNGEFMEDLLAIQLASPPDFIIQRIGFVYLQNSEKFKVYEKYCVNHEHASSTLQSLWHADKAFGAQLCTLEQDPSCRGLNLGSLLLEPVQRLARYPLLFKQILHYTPKGHPDILDLQKCIAISEALLNSVNEAMRSTQDRQYLITLSDSLVFKDPSSIIDLTTETNDLGLRKLVYEGILVKVRSGRKLEGFLFNDLFLLTETGGVMGKKKVYRLPLLISELSVIDHQAGITSFSKSSNPPFKIMDKAGSSLMVYAENSIARKSWLEHFSMVKSRLEIRPKPKSRIGGIQKPTLNHCIGTIRVSILAGNISMALLNAPLYINVRLNTQLCQTNPSMLSASLPNSQGQQLSWNQSFIMAVLSLDEILTVSLHAYQKFSKDQKLAMAELPLDFLEYYSGHPTETMHLDMYDYSDDAIGGVSKKKTGQLTIQLHYKEL